MDATFGGGGHSKAILEKLDDGKLVGFDKDEDAEKNAPTDERFIFINHDFRHLKRFLRLHGIKQVDGILADLGISSHQIDTADRGFSIRFDADLDMRMDKTQALSAQQIVNDFEEEEVVKIFSEYGEIRNSKQLANELLIARAAAPILTTEQLKLAVEPAVRGNPNRYFAQLFQAIRITVNDEMNGLKEFIEQSEEALKPGGRLAVISYHSLEDRPVKNFIKNGSFDGELKKDSSFMDIKNCQKQSLET